MAVSIEVTCDGEGCREAVSREPADPRRGSSIGFADHDDQRVLVDCRPLVNVTGQEPADHFIAAAGPTRLLASEGWTAERTAPTKRYPQGLIFRCPNCAAGEGRRRERLPDRGSVTEPVSRVILLPAPCELLVHRFTLEAKSRTVRYESCVCGTRRVTIRPGGRPDAQWIREGNFSSGPRRNVPSQA